MNPHNLALCSINDGRTYAARLSVAFAPHSDSWKRLAFVRIAHSAWGDEFRAGRAPYHGNNDRWSDETLIAAGAELADYMLAHAAELNDDEACKYRRPFSREDYMANACAHDVYYAQFVGTAARDSVACAIGAERIRRAISIHFNDIPLKEWDAIAYQFNGRIQAHHARTGYTGGVSLADGVCAAKAAAMLIRAGG